MQERNTVEGEKEAQPLDYTLILIMDDKSVPFFSKDLGNGETIAKVYWTKALFLTGM